MGYKLIKPAPERIYSPPTIREQVLQMCNMQYKNVDQGAFSDKSGSWIECRDTPIKEGYKCIVFSFNYEGTELSYVHCYTHVYDGGLTSKRII